MLTEGHVLPWSQQNRVRDAKMHIDVYRSKNLSKRITAPGYIRHRCALRSGTTHGCIPLLASKTVWYFPLWHVFNGVFRDCTGSAHQARDHTGPHRAARSCAALALPIQDFLNCPRSPTFCGARCDVLFVEMQQEISNVADG